MNRVLAPGGGVVLIDPYYGPLSSILYPVLFRSETFDKTHPDWKSQPEVKGVMTGANQALSYIVFKRDRKKFEQLFPQFEIVMHKSYGNYLRYLVSGGLNFYQLIPNWLMPAVRFVEFTLTPIQHLFALHHLIVLRKKS